MLPDLNSILKARRSSSPAAILAADATLTGEIIDMAGYESLQFFVLLGALTDSVLTCTVYEDTASNMATETAVADANLIGQTNAFVIDGTDADNDNIVVGCGYKGTKRYVRLKIVQSAATTGGYVCSVALQGNPRFLPIATVVADT